jgi:hypothetical protein
MPEHEHPPIPISWLSREDAAHCRPELAQRINKLDEGEIEYIGEKLGDALQDTYWLALGIILDDLFAAGKEQHVERTDL